MNLLVTAGNTQARIDRVRCLTNIFTGRTGAAIALEAASRGHAVLLLTSHPDTVPTAREGLFVRTYQTFEDLQEQMAAAIRSGCLDAVIHSAAVSDYLSGGVYAPAPGSRFETASRSWEGSPPTLHDRAAGKVKSDEPELWLRLIKAPKLIDLIRTDWGFHRILVKFKLEVGLADADLLAVAERSRQHSQADLMVANTLEGSSGYAFLGPLAGAYERVQRTNLPARLLNEVERLHQEKKDG
jgi:phosphopantothenoylcysteine synthetase/decarboxylase